MLPVSVLVFHQQKELAQNTKNSLNNMSFFSENSYSYFNNFEKPEIWYSGCRKMW